MCLVLYRTHKPKVEIAKRDITVWKKLNRTPDRCLVSPFRYMVYTLGETKTVKHFSDHLNQPFKTNKDLQALLEVWGSESVNQGLHAYFRKPSWLNKRNLFKAVIPKGTRFIKAHDFGTKDAVEIVALKMRLVKPRKKVDKS